MANVAELNESNFQSEVLNSDQPVLVDFWATWCAPCRMISPMIEKLAKENQGKAKVFKVNVSDQQSLAASFNVQSIPTLLVFKGGQVVASFVGAVSGLEAKLQQALDQATA